MEQHEHGWVQGQDGTGRGHGVGGGAGTGKGDIYSRYREGSGSLTGVRGRYRGCGGYGVGKQVALSLHPPLLIDTHTCKILPSTFSGMWSVKI